MPIAALYDVHGNLPALEAVLPELEDVDLVVVGGDVASGPFPRESLERLLALGERVRFVRGNADRVLDFAGYEHLGEAETWQRARLWVAERLGQDHLAFLAGLPLDVVVDGIRFCHGAPGSDEETITRVTPDERLARLLDGVEERVVVCGHTHVQFDRRLGRTRVLNAGSVGVPYESEPGAYWLLLDRGPSFRRTQYDLDDAIRRIAATGYPKLDEYLGYLLGSEPDRPERMSRLIEGV